MPRLLAQMNSYFWIFSFIEAGRRLKHRIEIGEIFYVSVIFIVRASDPPVLFRTLHVEGTTSSFGRSVHKTWHAKKLRERHGEFVGAAQSRRTYFLYFSGDRVN